MKLRLRLVFCLLISATFPLAFAQRVDTGREKPGDELKGAAAQAQLLANAAERDALIEERRQALLRAEKASTHEEKQRIMQELKATQKKRRAALRENEAKVREAEKIAREAARPAGAANGTH